MPLSCPSCQSAMTPLGLDGHLGTTVVIDLCRTCQAFWFDGRESLQLTPGSTLRLFREIGEHTGQANAAVRQRTGQTADQADGGGPCPRCGMRLKPVHDLQRTTRFQYLRCPARHGRFISFLDFLREKNFIRPMTPDQLEGLRRNVHAVNCSNCGAPVDLATASTCGHCGSPLSMLDLTQAASLIAQLREADAGKATIDPALSLNLLSAKRDVSAAFDAFEGQADTGLHDVDLVQMGLQLLRKWL